LTEAERSFLNSLISGEPLPQKQQEGGQRQTFNEKIASNEPSPLPGIDANWQLRITELRNRVPCLTADVDFMEFSQPPDLVARTRSFTRKEDFDDESAPFLVLGVNQPGRSPIERVLSPAIMEAFLGFLPVGVARHNYWLKYSTARHVRWKYYLFGS